MILKTKQRLKIERHNLLIEKLKIASNDDKKTMRPIDSIETYAYGTSKVKKKKLSATV